MLNKKVIKCLLEEIQREDELPSKAGVVFKSIIEQQFGGMVGMREIRIITEWLDKYSELDFDSQNEIADKLFLNQ